MKYKIQVQVQGSFKVIENGAVRQIIYDFILYIHLYSPMNGRKNAKQYKNNAVTLTILKYSATVIEHI